MLNTKGYLADNGKIYKTMAAVKAQRTIAAKRKAIENARELAAKMQETVSIVAEQEIVFKNKPKPFKKKKSKDRGINFHKISTEELNKKIANIRKLLGE